MAQFKPPYGTTDQHVTDPTQHFGYRFLVAYLVDGGYYAQKIRQVCAEARKEGAPRDACLRRLAKFGGGWITRDHLSDHRTRRRVDSYAAALLKYEEDVKAEQAAQR